MKRTIKQLLVKIETQALLIFMATAALFGLFGFWGSWNQVLKQILTFPLGLALAALTATSINYLVRWFRFYFFLRSLGIGISFGKAGLIFVSGLAMTITPGKSGELGKAYLIKKFTLNKTSFSAAAPIVIIERATDALGTLILLSWGLWHYQSTRLVLVGMIISLIIFFLVLSQPVLFDKIYLLMKRWTLFRPISNHIRQFHNSISRLLKARILVLGSLLALMAWSFEVIAMALVFYGITGNQVNLQILAVLAFIFVFASILGFISLIPGGVGVADGSKLGLLIWILSLTKSQAVSVVILTRLFTLWFGVSLGVAALIYLSYRLKNNND